MQESSFTKKEEARLRSLSFGEAREVSAMRMLRIALCQMNPTLGDLEGNIEKMERMVVQAEENGAEIVVFPELVISGYPPQDILKYDGANRQMEDAERDFMGFLCERRTKAIVVWGNIRQAPSPYGAGQGIGLRNSAKVFLPIHTCDERKIHKAEYQDKRYLPNYGVFDEHRYFRAGNDELSKLFISRPFSFGVTICEDIWYQQNHLPDFALNGGGVVININASPFHEGKPEQREQMIRSRARDNQIFILYCNIVGGQDGVVFDGGSMVVGPSGNLIARAKMFEEDILYADLDLAASDRVRLSDTRLNNLSRPEVEVIPFDFFETIINSKISPRIETYPNNIAQIYKAIVLMTRDYVRKNGFEKVVIGASGGIDSALVVAIAADALEGDNVRLLLLPSRYSSKGSVDDARKLAINLKARRGVILIQDAVDALKKSLSRTLGDITGTLTEENLQARVRANILMAYANSHPDTLLLSTGNKSEVSVGYFTLYGDSAGAFDPLLDVYKTVVYELAKYRNSLGSEVIPREIITKPPSAELREDQEDTDSLPPYEKLDALLRLHIEGCMTSDEIIDGGFCKEQEISEKEVRRIIWLVQRSEHKRQQTTLGSKISPIAFGIGRRMPNVNRIKL